MSPPSNLVLPALRSRLDFSVLHAMRARRAARERCAADKLALVRRLAQSALLGALPETRVEQSWNEQVFAKLLDYRTLLSHTALPFHVLPKNAAGARRFDDFSLGFFGIGEDIVLGTAELKSPGTDLDARQWTGNYRGTTPVEQALSAARGHGAACRWVLVSNFRELRLYDARSPDAPLATVADLRDVRNPDDLALLCAHFDAAALLGEHGKDNAEMLAALDAAHPSHPLPPRADNCRLVLRFTRKDGLVLPLFRVERALREAADAASRAASLSLAPRDRKFLAKDGWVAVENSPVARLAASRFGDVQLSVTMPLLSEPQCTNGNLHTSIALDTTSLFESVHAFAMAVAAFHRINFGKSPLAGSVSGELREVMGTMLRVESMEEPAAPTAGRCDSHEISAGDFDCAGGSAVSLASPLASCVCEFAVHFRSPQGGVGLSHRELTTFFERKLAQE